MVFSTNASGNLRNKHKETILYGPASLDGHAKIEMHHGNELVFWQTFRPISPTGQPTDCRVTSSVEFALCYIRFGVLAAALH